MTYRSHRIGGACAGALGIGLIMGIPKTPEEFGFAITLTGAALLGSLLPDIDHPNSKVSRRNPILAALVNLFLVIGKTITQMILLLCFWMSKKRKEQILKGFEHRGIFHTLLMGALVWLLLGLIPGTFGVVIQWGITLGYLSHLLMDMLTVSGVKLLYPIITHSFHYPIIRLHTNNQLHEMTAQAIFIVATVAILYFGRSYWGILANLF